ncbi:MAG TPA: M14 family zinc carboxypeptidase [Thermoanaerobaculia bacterium]|nr:M14 family zinc carboxypeptidase [Thermoanaerobaculia bacterium]
MKRLLTLLLFATTLVAQPVDDEYTKQIRAFTTGPQFMTDLVDHLPASDRVPSPLRFHGYIAGAENRLTYAEDVYRYMRAVEAATPRVRVFPIGKSEEGREMILVAVSDEANLAALDRYKDITRRLSDPRKISDADAAALIAEGKPMYYATGAMHSPETGSPEMLMELVYRLAVEETPLIQNIRRNVIALFTPVLEVDGRNRMVDLWRYRQANPNVPTPPLIYWGHYVAHDNNRDNIGLALNLSRNVMKAYFDFHPQVIHDLHESIPFLYASTGTGPYNPALDPLMIDEWHRMAYHEVNELTQRGLPGIWTHGFYDGWAPNYMFWIGMGHNTIGRFYETFGNRWPTTETRIVRDASERAWYRPNPPLAQVRWSLRNNVNFSQSGVLLALSDMARNREHFLKQFWTLSKRSVAKAANEGPAAYVIDGAQKRQGNVRELLTVLSGHGIEIHVADAAFSLAPGWPPPKDKEKQEEKVSFAKGSYVIRMDQPYSRLADTLLDVQYVRPDERVYDDTGWTLGYLKNVDVRRIANAEVLKVSMKPWTPPATAALAIDGGRLHAVENAADISLARLRFANPSAKMSVAEEEFTSKGRKFPPGTVIVEGTVAGATPLDAMPKVGTRDLRAPRIALLHSWLRTQDEGWYRLGLESLGVPYTYICTQDVGTGANLRDRFDVIIFPPVGGGGDIVNGLPPGPPLPWKKTELTPNLGGIDETDDMRPGLGLSGVAALTRFVEDGGLLITVRDTAVWAIDYGLVRWVRVTPSTKLKAPGTIVSATVTDKKSPVAWGYDEKLPVYYSGSPIFTVGYRNEPPVRDSRPSGRGGKNDPDIPQGRGYVELPERPKPGPGEEGFMLPEDAPWNVEAYLPRPEDRPRVIVSFAAKAEELPLSGMLDGGEDIAGKPVVIAAPRGRGHVLLFANNPMWRMNTQGSYALVMNAIMNWDSLR